MFKQQRERCLRQLAIQVTLMAFFLYSNIVFTLHEVCLFIWQTQEIKCFLRPTVRLFSVMILHSSFSCVKEVLVCIFSNLAVSFLSSQHHLILCMRGGNKTMLNNRFRCLLEQFVPLRQLFTLYTITLLYIENAGILLSTI